LIKCVFYNIITTDLYLTSTNMETVLIFNLQLVEYVSEHFCTDSKWIALGTELQNSW